MVRIITNDFMFTGGNGWLYHAGAGHKRVTAR